MSKLSVVWTKRQEKVFLLTTDTEHNDWNLGHVKTWTYIFKHVECFFFVFVIFVLALFVYIRSGITKLKKKNANGLHVASGGYVMCYGRQ